MFKYIKPLLGKFGIYDHAANFYIKNIVRYSAKLKGINIKYFEKDGIKCISFLRGQKEIIISEKNYIYSKDIIKEYDYYFNSVEFNELSTKKTVDYSKKREHKLKKSGLIFEFVSLPESEETTDLYIKNANLKNGDVVLDLGCYCGASTHAFSKQVGLNGKVYAFEPDPLSFASLKQNIQRHCLENVILFNNGVWSERTKLNFQSEGNLGSSITSISGRKNGMVKIDVISINDLVLDYKIDRIDFIKMDIEGAETYVLKSIPIILQKFKPRLIIEPHFVNGKLNTQEIIEFLKCNKYECKILQQGECVLPLIYAIHQEGSE